MAQTPIFGFLIYNTTTALSAADLTRLRRITETQLAALLTVLGQGVIDDGTGERLQITDGGGLDVVCDTGSANIQSDDGNARHFAVGYLDTVFTVEGLEDDRDENNPVYIHARLVEPHNSALDEDGAAELATEEGTAPLEIFASDDESVAGAILLAEVRTASGAIDEIIDHREYVPLSQVLSLVEAVGLPWELEGTAQAEIVALKARVDELEESMGGGETGVSQAYVDNAIAQLRADLEALIATGGVTREDPKQRYLLSEVASLDLGVTEIHREHARRSRATRVSIGIHGDGSGGSVDDLYEATSTVDTDLGVIGPT